MNAFVRTQLTALVVDEKMFVRRTMNNVLRSLGLTQISDAADGAAAAAKIDGVDVVFCDTTVETNEAMDVIRRAAECENAPAIVLMTGPRGHGVERLRTAAEVRGLKVLGAVEKPVTAHVAQGMLNKLIAGATNSAMPVLASRLTPPAQVIAWNDPDDLRSPYVPEATGLHYEPDGPARTADICSYLFQICKRCQTELLDARGITCRFDVTGGNLPVWQCEILGRAVQTVLSDICKDRPANGRNAAITVALRHRADVWILAIADSNVRIVDPVRDHRSAGLARSLVRPLNGVWRTRPTASGALTTLLFVDAASEDEGCDFKGQATDGE
jgi:CheY-like chemotaxis protein